MILVRLAMWLAVAMGVLVLGLVSVHLTTGSMGDMRAWQVPGVTVQGLLFVIGGAFASRFITRRWIRPFSGR